MKPRDLWDMLTVWTIALVLITLVWLCDVHERLRRRMSRRG